MNLENLRIGLNQQIEIWRQGEKVGRGAEKRKKSSKGREGQEGSRG